MDRQTHVQVKRFWSIEPLDYATVRAGFAKILRELEIEWIQAPYAPDFPEIISDVTRLPGVPPAWHQDLNGSFKPRGLVVWSNIMATELLCGPFLSEGASSSYLTLADGAIYVIDNVEVKHRGPSQLRLTPQRSMPFRRAFCRAWLSAECANRILDV